MSAKAAAQTKATKPAGEELKDAIKRQVEFYFSRANLANDAFLVSQMNSQMYVPIETIIGFQKIKQLTDSVELLVESILDSTVVVLNETKDAIKPNVKSERNTIILREIPSATKPEDVQAIFDGCGEVLSVRSDVGDTWFVTLASEDEAVKTLLALRNKTFNDAPIKARLKSENVLKSFYPATSSHEPAAAATTAAGAYARGYYATGTVGYYDMPNNYGVQYASAPRGQYNGSAPRQGGGGRGSSQQPGQRGGRGNVNTQQPKEGRSKSGSFDQQQQRPASRKAKDKKAKAASAASQNAAPAKKAAAPATERQPVLNSANFPPLPLPEKVVEEIKFKYAHEDILEIVKHMDENDCKLPEDKMDFEAHAVALTPVAHPDLLRNQRTYSIEQARDAMRQGRPIRSDSIGSIDYESMMYGEDYTKEARELRKQAAESGEKKPEAPAAAATPAAPTAAAAAAAPKVLGYAAAVILGTPAPQPPLETKKKPVAAAANAAPAAPAKAKGAKPAKDEAKKSTKKGPKTEAKAAVVDEVPKAGAWGGRAFSEVVKAEPVNPPPAPVKAAAPVASVAAVAAAPANGKKIASTPSGEWVKDKTFKDRRQTEQQ